MRCSERHKKTDKMGHGLCSVPMWCNGVQDGFCDNPAFGEREGNQFRYGTVVTGQGWVPGFVPGLACYSHGGPKSRVYLDGDKWCAVLPDFENLAESPAGFGDTPEEARAQLAQAAR